MPELPEVETIRRDLERSVLEKPILGVEVFDPSVVKADVKIFGRALKSNAFVSVLRRGKLLIFALDKPSVEGFEFMVCHLRMTGQLILRHTVNLTDADRRFLKVLFDFGDGLTLAFNEIRKFGFLQLLTAAELKVTELKFGVEPLSADFERADFSSHLLKRSTPIKNALLDQHFIAGIGNIYADEICFASKVSPVKLCKDLSKKELDALFDNTIKILTEAVRLRGTSFRDYRDGKGNKGLYVDSLKVYGRGGLECLECAAVKISKIKVAGRGTHYCGNCQL